MFDTHLLVSGQHTTKIIDRNITVNEHRAPTDESVKLLNELTEKAKDNFIGCFDFNNNVFNAIVMLSFEPLTNMVQFLVRYKLNHQSRDVKFEIDANILSLDSTQRESFVSKRIISEVSKDIALLFQAFIVPGHASYAPQFVMPNANIPTGQSELNTRWAAKNMFVFNDGVNEHIDADIQNKFDFIKSWTDDNSLSSIKLVDKIKNELLWAQ